MSEKIKVKKEGKRWLKSVEINTLYDLEGIDIEEAKKIMKDKGVTIEPLPEVELGNLALDNLHIDYTMGMEYRIKKGKGYTIPIFITREGLQEAKLNKDLVVKAMTEQESLIRYAESVREEYESMIDEDLLKYDTIENKRYARSRDECLRRKLIEKAGEKRR